MSYSLDNLDPYFPSIHATEEEKIDELYSIFEEDLYLKTLEVDNIIVRCKRHGYNPEKDGLPSFYAKYYEKFVHTITRKYNAARQFEAERANRVHWIRPILENHTDPRITHFKHREGDGTIRDYFWYKAKSFIVILEEVLPEYIMITAFCVDSNNRRHYERKESNSI